MKKQADAAGAYVHKARGDMQRYVQDLLSENERLRVLVATLENGRARLAERARSTEALLDELDVLRGIVVSLERDKQRLQELLLAAQLELEGRRSERVGVAGAGVHRSPRDRPAATPAKNPRKR